MQRRPTRPNASRRVASCPGPPLRLRAHRSAADHQPGPFSGLLRVRKLRARRPRSSGPPRADGPLLMPRGHSVDDRGLLARHAPRCSPANARAAAPPLTRARRSSRGRVPGRTNRSSRWHPPAGCRIARQCGRAARPGELSCCGTPAAATARHRTNAASPRRCGIGSPLATIAPASSTRAAVSPPWTRLLQMVQSSSLNAPVDGHAR